MPTNVSDKTCAGGGRPHHAAAAEPKVLMIIPGASHVDFYDRTDIIPFDKLDTFFHEHLTRPAALT